MRKLTKTKVCLFVDGTNEETVEGVLSDRELATLKKRISSYMADCFTRRGADRDRLKTEAEHLRARLAELGE